MLCAILANSGKINPNSNRAKKAQACTQGKGEPTTQWRTGKPSQNPYSLPKQNQRKEVSPTFISKRERKAILTN